jgi:competence protein ComEC
MTGMAVGAAALVGVAFGWWAAAATAMGCIALSLLTRDRAMVASCALVVVAAALGAHRAGGDGTKNAAPVLVGSSLSIMRVVEAPVRTGRSQRFVVEPATADSSKAAAMRVCIVGNALPVIRFGDTVRLGGDPLLATDVSAAHRAFLATKGCEASMFATSMVVVSSTPTASRTLADVRARIGEVLSGAAPGDAGVLLTGLVIGDDAGFSPARESAFIRTGTTHLTAVSGSNLALIAGILATIGAATIGRHRLTWQVITVGAVWTYALIAGAQAPALRAAIVASAAVLAFRVGRRPDFPTLIVLAAGAMALLEPGRVDALGFRLSVAASLALAVVLPGLIESDRVSPLGAAVAATAAAQLATLPLLLPVFGTVSLVSLPANLVAAPLVAVAMPLAALAGLTGLVWVPLAETIAAPAALVATVMIGAMDSLSGTGGYVLVGIPPNGAAAAIALTTVLALLIVSGDAQRWVARTMRTTRTSMRSRASAVAVGNRPGLKPCAPVTPEHQAPDSSSLALPPPRIVAREQPADALRADADYAVEHPAGEKDSHQIANIGQRGQAIPRQLVRHCPAHHLHETPDHDDGHQQAKGELLSPPAHEGDVVPAEEIEQGR